MLKRLFKLDKKYQSEIPSPQQQNHVKPPIEKMAGNIEEAIHLAGQKWEAFHDVMKKRTSQLQAEVLKNDRWGAIFRISIIILSASVTVISAVVVDNQKYIATTIGGVLTALAGIEAYFQFNRRETEAKQQQREVEALRYKLRHQWITTVQMDKEVENRFKAAIKFLQDGQEAYNVILNKYAMKDKE